MNENTLTLLRDSFTEAQAAVRAYDTKAQIVGVGYIFSLSITGRIGELLPGADTTADLWTILAAWAVVIMPIILFGRVLYPTRKSTLLNRDEIKPDMTHILFIDSDNHNSIEAMKQAIMDTNPVDEYLFEILTLSKLRDKKRNRFIRGLIAVGLAFLVLFTHQVLSAIGLLN